MCASMLHGQMAEVLAHRIWTCGCFAGGTKGGAVFVGWHEGANHDTWIVAYGLEPDDEVEV